MRRSDLNWLIGGAAIVLVAAVVAAAVLALGGEDEPRRRSIESTPVATDEMEVSVAVVDNDFEPRVLHVRSGARVTWRHEGDIPHDVTQYEGAFESGLMQRDDAFTFTATLPGTYDYYCTLHHAMQGTLVVR